MEYEIFLNKEDQKSYSLLKYLEKSLHLSEPVAKIQADLGFSDFILKKALKKLTEDLERMNLAQNFQLLASDLELTLKIDGTYSSKKLLSEYLKESLSVKLIIALYKGEFKSIEDFAEKNFVSYSVAYNTLQVLNQTGKLYGIVIRRGTVLDSEGRVASVIGSLFSLANIDYPELYPFGVIVQTERIVQQLQERYPLSTCESKKLFHYIAIKIHDGKLSRAADRGSRYFPAEPLALVSDLLPKQYQEIDYHIVSWLFVNNKLGQEVVIDDLGADVSALNQLFIEKFAARYGMLPTDVTTRLVQCLSRLHFNVLYRSINMSDMIDLDFNVFKRYWQDFYLFAVDRTNNLICEVPELLRFKEFVLFSYLMLLIDHVPVDLLTHPVRVLIDFSYGEKYNRLIWSHLERCVKVNTVLAPSIEQADLVITNSNDLYKDNDLETIVWPDLPRSVDWLMLRNHLIALQKERPSENES